MAVHARSTISTTQLLTLMTRNIFIFLATFVVGALAALVTRAAMFKPYSGHEGHPAPKEYSAMVSNSLAPAASAGSASRA